MKENRQDETLYALFILAVFMIDLELSYFFSGLSRSLRIIRTMIERNTPTAIAIQLIAKHIGRDDDLWLEIFEHRFGCGFVALNDCKFLYGY